MSAITSARGVMWKNRVAGFSCILAVYSGWNE